MSGVRITADFEAGEAAAALRRWARLGREPAPLLRAIGTGLARNTRRRFDLAQDPEGHAWPALSPAYAALKRGPGILRESAMRGGLQGSVAFDVAGAEVAVGSNKIYAAIHQFGGTIRPRTAGGRLAFRMGDRLVFARSVTIPARPYLGLSAEDEDTVLDAALSMLARRGA